MVSHDGVAVDAVLRVSCHSRIIRNSYSNDWWRRDEIIGRHKDYVWALSLGGLSITDSRRYTTFRNAWLAGRKFIRACALMRTVCMADKEFSSDAPYKVSRSGRITKQKTDKGEL